MISPPRPPGPALPDLDRRAEIHDLVVAFYRDLVMDDLLGPLFEEVAEVDWSEHLPRLVDYWCRVLLGELGYRGAIVQAHGRVHELEPFTAAHFDRWLALFVHTVDDRWAGPRAEQAKDHASRIADALARQLSVPLVRSVPGDVCPRVHPS